jgi:phosphate transport system protein
MTHYEKRLEEDLTRIRDQVRAVASRVREAVSQSVRALLANDRALANEIILGDLRINREIRAIDQLCHAFVARHLPSAGHLRFVSSVLRLTVALERVGDYAVTIGREAVQLTGAPPPDVARDVELMADQARRLLRESTQAFDEGNAELARGAKAMASQADTVFGRVFADLLREGEAGNRPLKELFALLTVFNALERVTDQAENICEETIFAVTGEAKAPKTYRVLFVDERNDRLSQLAQAFARKAYPASGRYESAGWQPADSLDPHCRAFLERHGYDLAEAQPRRLEPIRSDLAAFHVIVSLGGDLCEHMPEIPFRTVLLEWNIEAGAGSPERAIEEAFRQVALKVRELMETLRGADAE